MPDSQTRTPARATTQTRGTCPTPAETRWLQDRGQDRELLRLAIAAQLPHLALIVEDPTIVLDQGFVAAYDRQALRLVSIAGKLVHLESPGSSRLRAVHEAAVAVGLKTRRALALIRGALSAANEQRLVEGFTLLSELDQDLVAWSGLHMRVCSA